MTASEIHYGWREAIGNRDLNALHADGFGDRGPDRDWVTQLSDHSLGWVVARRGPVLVGFVNVAWDGGVHAFLLDTLVDRRFRRRSIATRLVEVAARHARVSGCEWLHVDFETDLAPLYLDACGFNPTAAGLLRLKTIAKTAGSEAVRR